MLVGFGLWFDRGQLERQHSTTSMRMAPSVTVKAQ
jgi:hypothetical protein